VNDLPSLHRAAREIFDEALGSVDAGEAVRRAVRLEDARLKIVNSTFELAHQHTGIYSVAIGKAAPPMAYALGEILGDHLTGGVISAPSNAHASLSKRWRVFEGGHPLPNAASLDASLAAFDLLHRAEGERALLIFLISGGGSAMMEWPRSNETTLEELQAMHRALVSCGASIAEINAVRRAVSGIKGGGLSRRAPRCDQVTLIVSDTNAGDEATVASGPTFAQALDESDAAAAVIARYHLDATLPQAILRAVRQSSKTTLTVGEHGARAHYVLLENHHALAAAAEAARLRGFTVEVARDVLEQPIREGCSMFLSRLVDFSRRVRTEGRGLCLISGGEFACPVRGRGVGGRNAETVLRLAIELEACARQGPSFSHTVALSAGTDGLDGNSPAAGAVCDETTIERARSLNLAPRSFLDESDAYTFFQTLSDAIITGPTETNVRDLRILLAS
jgi:glycerate 2-kinase